MTQTMTAKKLIEVALPPEAINTETASERYRSTGLWGQNDGPHTSRRGNLHHLS
jgi:hypothetical protein